MGAVDVRMLSSNPYQYVTKSNTKFIPLGTTKLAEAMNDLPTGKMTVVTGYPKDGKSTWLHQMALTAVDKGCKVLIVDGEHRQEELISDLYTKVIANAPNSYMKVKYNKKYVLEPTLPTLKLLTDWHKDNLIIFSKYLSSLKFDNLDEIFSFTERVVKTYGIDLVIWDNLMTLVEGTQAEKFENQSRFMKRATDLLKSTNTHGILVAHPNKNVKPGERMTIYDVLGSSDIVNLTDYLIQVMRNHKKEFHSDIDGWVRLILNRPYGETLEVPMRYKAKSKSLFEMDKDGEPIEYEYGWLGEHEQTQLANAGFINQF